MHKIIILIFINTAVTYPDATAQFNTIFLTGNSSKAIKPHFNSDTPAVSNLNFQKTDSVTNKITLNVTAPLRFYSPVTGLAYSSAYGMRLHPVLKKVAMHSGVDIRAYYSPVYSFAAGVVTVCTYDDRAGLYIKIYHGNGIETIYAHLNQAFVKSGDTVIAGQLIAQSGNSGMSIAAHLHFGVKWNGHFINPVILISNLNRLNRNENQ